MEISADAPVASEIPEGFKRYLCSQCSKPQVTAIDDDSLGGLCMECRRAWHRNKDKKPSAPVEAPAAATPPTTPLSLDLPDECLYGKLGDIARSLQVPLGFAYPCVLTVASCLGVQDIGGNVRSNLYTALIGGIGSGKTVAKDRALQSIFLPDLSFTRTTPGSDRGLIKILGTLGGPMLLVQDELRNLLTKMQTPGSGGSLVAILCDLWSEDIAGAGDKKGVDECDCKLSILGNIPCEDATDFSTAFGHATTRGLYWTGIS